VHAFLTNDARACSQLREATREPRFHCTIRDRNDVARTTLLDDVATREIAPSRHDFLRRHLAHDSRDSLDINHVLALDSALARLSTRILARIFSGRPAAPAIARIWPVLLHYLHFCGAESQPKVYSDYLRGISAFEFINFPLTIKSPHSLLQVDTIRLDRRVTCYREEIGDINMAKVVKRTTKTMKKAPTKKVAKKNTMTKKAPAKRAVKKAMTKRAGPARRKVAAKARRAPAKKAAVRKPAVRRKRA
jgi:hypothetical protein